jgi:hypothetical protein
MAKKRRTTVVRRAAPLRQHKNRQLRGLLKDLDLGSSVAETDNVLGNARVETSVFHELLGDRVDLIQGTKGSGKSALFRLVIDYLEEALLRDKKVVIAHGVSRPDDNIFHAFRSDFDQFTEDDFEAFWVIYFATLARDNFIEESKFDDILRGCKKQMAEFRDACALASIPTFEMPKERRSLRVILEWIIGLVRPKKVTYKSAGGDQATFEFAEPVKALPSGEPPRTQPLRSRYLEKLRIALQAILGVADLQLWLMIDRLDELFLRRSDTERKALRGLLRASLSFRDERIRIKIFLRDDIFEHITETADGFAALTHVTARMSARLEWTESQILTFITRRLLANSRLCRYLSIRSEGLSPDEQEKIFYQVFPPTVHTGDNQSATLRWIYQHCSDAKGVVTPRDVLDLLTNAIRRQHDNVCAHPRGLSQHIITSDAILYGHDELSIRKRDTYIKAEFPHFWSDIEKLEKGKTEYSEGALHRRLGGKQIEKRIASLVDIGILAETRKENARTWKVPFLYRRGLALTQGFEEH